MTKLRTAIGGDSHLPELRVPLTLDMAAGSTVLLQFGVAREADAVWLRDWLGSTCPSASGVLALETGGGGSIVQVRLHPPPRDSSMAGCFPPWRWRVLANSVRCGRVYD